jgi:hypothetical protein
VSLPFPIPASPPRFLLPSYGSQQQLDLRFPYSSITIPSYLTLVRLYYTILCYPLTYVMI